MRSSFENTIIIILITFLGNFEKLRKLSLKMCIFCNIYLVGKINMILQEILRKVSAYYTLLVYDLEFTTPC